MTGVRFACGVLAVSMIGAIAMAQDLPLTQGFMRNQMHPLDPTRDICVRLVEGAKRVLPALPEQISLRAQNALTNLRVDVLTGTRVCSVHPESVVVGDNRELRSDIGVSMA